METFEIIGITILLGIFITLRIKTPTLSMEITNSIIQGGAGGNGGAGGSSTFGNGGGGGGGAPGGSTVIVQMPTINASSKKKLEWLTNTGIVLTALVDLIKLFEFFRP